jgi:DNA-binding transcriptional LysR family regulator
LAGRQIGTAEFSRINQLAVRPSLDWASQIDKRLRRFGATRRVVLNLSQFQAVPDVLRKSDLVACVLHSVTEQYDHSEFYFCPVPFPLDRVKVVVAWSRSRTGHAANAWMRQTLVEACDVLRGPSAKGIDRTAG